MVTSHNFRAHTCQLKPPPYKTHSSLNIMMQSWLIGTKLNMSTAEHPQTDISELRAAVNKAMHIAYVAASETLVTHRVHDNRQTFMLAVEGDN